MTPNNELTAEELLKRAIVANIRRNRGTIDVEVGVDQTFALLWPYVGKAWRAGKTYGIKEMKEFHGGPENEYPCEDDFLTQSLTELKTKADEHTGKNH